MNRRQHKILRAFRQCGGRASSNYLAGYIIGCPLASVRRDIQALRREGYVIDFDGQGYFILHESLLTPREDTPVEVTL